ncbi:27857_t:CDS:10 [Dentiscutata erythropus]|uniref:phospholipase D n=1 Tax=Dentiscutata erythropus TaxID=1348616 RepID=A0A9N9HMF7_9GLOM|nr:27857_t:CDS:10 [Dentiscutata erythropus]
METNPYGSFASPKENVYAKCFNGRKNEIFIEDWWLSPELYLRRPPAHNDNENYRLDKLLLKKATEGVKIYIVLYDENPKVLYLNSRYAESTLMKHPNIIVFRHAENNFWSTVEWGFNKLWNGVFPSADSVKHPEIDPDSFWSKIVVIDRHTAFIGGLDLCFGRYDTHVHSLTDFPTFAKLSEVWPGQDYNNVRIKDFEEVQKWKNVLISKEISARMPWHDISIGFNVGIILNPEKQEITLSIPFLKEAATDESPGVIRTYKYFNETAEVDSLKGTCSVQILRSASKWSHGIELEALVKRIIKAHKLQEKFRVIVVMPLIPGFEGQFDEESESSTVLRLTMDFQYRSICRGDDKCDDSIWGQLKKADINPEDYISFYGLRTYAKIDSEAIKKAKINLQIYIHSKLMIVDDQIVICGSANLNDRSQIGKHDSEIAAIIKDTDEINSKLAGKSFKASKFAVSLRRHLFKEHLGLLQDSEHEKDPVSDGFFKLWRGIAEENTKIYDEVFHCLPSDNVKTQSDYENFAPKPNKGHLVLFPYDFLKGAETITFHKIKTLKDLKDDFGEAKLSVEDGLIEDLTGSSLSAAFK